LKLLRSTAQVRDGAIAIASSTNPPDLNPIFFLELYCGALALWVKRQLTIIVNMGRSGKGSRGGQKGNVTKGSHGGGGGAGSGVPRQFGRNAAKKHQKHKNRVTLSKTVRHHTQYSRLTKSQFFPIWVCESWAARCTMPFMELFAAMRTVLPWMSLRSLRRPIFLVLFTRSHFVSSFPTSRGRRYQIMICFAGHSQQHCLAEAGCAARPTRPSAGNGSREYQAAAWDPLRGDRDLRLVCVRFHRVVAQQLARVRSP
jgi:hypothetical protein